MGEYIRKSFTFEGKRYFVKGRTEEEAIIKRAEKKKALEEGRVVVSSSMTVSDWAYKAVAAYKTGQKEITRKKYIDRMRHCVLEEMGHMPLSKVKPIHCQNVLNIQAGKSKAHISEVSNIIKFIFRTARMNGLVATDPAENIIKPAGTKHSRRAITEYEREIFLKVADEEPRFLFFLFMLFCGCRPSEAAEIQGRDIGLLKGYPVLYIRGTKTENAVRVVPIPQYLFERLPDVIPDEYVVHNRNGKKYVGDRYSNLTKLLYRKMNIAMGCRMYRNKLIKPFPLADDFVPYDLRHTYCTDLQKKGVDIRVAQYLMGHSDISLTANIYTHADQTTIVDAAKTINGSHLGSHLIP